MKIKSLVLTIFSSIIAFSAVSLNQVSADDETKLDDAEKSQIVSAVKTRNEEVSDVNVYSVHSENMGGFDLSIQNYDVEKAYKLYPLEHLMITEYKKSSDFKSLITEGERIMLPAEGKLVTLMETDSVYEVIGIEYTDDVFDFNTLTDSIKNSIDEEIINVINTYNFMYYMNVIYVETAENEYAVPYFKEHSYSDYGDRLISGTVYSVPEFMDRMDQIYDEEYLIEHGNENGGVPIKEYSPYVPSIVGASSEKKTMGLVSEEASNNFAAVIVGIAAASAVIFLVTFFILNTKKQKKV